MNYFGQFQHFKEELKIIIIVKLFFQYGIDKTMYTEDMHFECILTNEGICFSCGMVSLYGWQNAKIQLQYKVTFSDCSSYTRDIY